jgi:hypothetical protein
MTNESDRNSSGRSESERNDSPDQSEQSTHQLRLPGFITDDEIGLGDVIKRTTSYLGIQSCGGCERRATKLNRWLVFTPRRSR